jgi:type I restriction enzyme S subunit
LGRGVSSINAKNAANAFLLWLLKYKFSKEDSIGNGSIFTSVTKEELLKQKLVIPSEDILLKYNSIASNIEKQIRDLTLQSANLTRQRDLLLPRLMSGQLTPLTNQ